MTDQLLSQIKKQIEQARANLADCERFEAAFAKNWAELQQLKIAAEGAKGTVKAKARAVVAHAELQLRASAKDVAEQRVSITAALLELLELEAEAKSC